MPTVLAIAMLLLALRMLWVARQRRTQDTARAADAAPGARADGGTGRGTGGDTAEALAADPQAHRPGAAGRHTIAVLTCLAMAAAAVVALLS